ncbi:MAG: hypothetical protein QM688_08755 [Sphingomonas bacterium]
MLWIARLLLLIPSLVAGWFVSREDPRFWVVALAIALTFMALGSLVGLYLPGLHPWTRKKD